MAINDAINDGWQRDCRRVEDFKNRIYSDSYRYSFSDSRLSRTIVANIYDVHRVVRELQCAY